MRENKDPVLVMGSLREINMDMFRLKPIRTTAGCARSTRSKEARIIDKKTKKNYGWRSEALMVAFFCATREVFFSFL